VRVFVYEYLTALGMGSDPADPLHSLYREGRVMRDAVAEDLGRIPGVEVLTFPDDGDPVTDDRFLTAVEQSDRQLLIAPELFRTLQSLTILAETKGRPLGCSPAAIELTSDKLALAEHWRAHGVPTPATTDRAPTGCENCPVVWKPRFGAGSTATFRVNHSWEWRRALAPLQGDLDAGPMILQEFVPGRPVSVALLCGSAGHFPLLPCSQQLSDDGRFKYLGGELPLSPDLSERAFRLARRAVGGVLGLGGYVGVDLVLGDAPDGSRDYAIEINPRLTTSYIGLRALAEFNIAEVLLRVAAGEPAGELRWKPGRVRFLPAGTIHPVSAGYQLDPRSDESPQI
jgi:predicted ATP-grasp superfamily ATP-dependent carboligase